MARLTLLLVAALPIVGMAPTRAVGAPLSSAPTEAGVQAFAHSPCQAAEARAFDFWHGDWDVNNRWLTDDGRWVDAGSAEVKVYSALDGCLTIEQWEGNLGPNRLTGFSARAWDEQAGEWVLLLNWPSPRSATFGTLRGRFRHGRGEFYSEFANAEGETVHQRYSFADIGPQSFRWDQAHSSDGQRWRTSWIMEYSRRDLTRELPVFAGPSRTTRRCDAAPYREFDFLLGDWTASSEIPRADGTSFAQEGTMRVLPILEGCAVLDTYEAADADGDLFQAFRIRAYDEAREVWVQYWFDTVDRLFQRFEGGREGDRLVLQGQLDADRPERIDRISWSDFDATAADWSYEISPDGGTSWRSHAHVRFQR